MWRVLGGLALGLAVAGSACAEVLEIGDDGQVTTYGVPAVFSESGVRPLISARGEEPATQGVAVALEESARRYGLDPRLLRAVATQESGLRTDAVSARGAVGIMQLMPATARDLGVNPAEPPANIDGGARYLAQMLRRFDGDVVRALAAYNAGPGAVARYGGVPPFAETRGYVSGVLRRIAAADRAGEVAR